MSERYLVYLFKCWRRFGLRRSHGMFGVVQRQKESSGFMYPDLGLCRPGQKTGICVLCASGRKWTNYSSSWLMGSPPLSPWSNWDSWCYSLCPFFCLCKLPRGTGRGCRSLPPFFCHHVASPSQSLNSFHVELTLHNQQHSLYAQSPGIFLLLLAHKTCFSPELTVYL